MASGWPVATSTATSAPPPTASLFFVDFDFMFSMPLVSDCSAADCRSRSIVRLTWSPGSGSVVYVVPVTVPEAFFVTMAVPFVPWRYFSKASSAPSLPTVALMG